MKNIIIFGDSGSGKDTIANYLVEKYNYKRIHPIGDLKKFFESYFNCPSLDTKEGKDFQIDVSDSFTCEFYLFLIEKLRVFNSLKIIRKLDYLFAPDYTLGNFMINLYHYCKDKDIPFSLSYVKETVKFPEPKVYIAIRNVHEAKILKSLPDYLILNLKRPEVNGLSTDFLQQDCLEMLKKNDNVVEIINDSSIEELYDKVGLILAGV